MNKDYVVPSQTRIGHVHLKIADLERSLGFYKDLLGFELTMMYPNQGGIPVCRRVSSSYRLEYMAH